MNLQSIHSCAAPQQRRAGAAAAASSDTACSTAFSRRPFQAARSCSSSGRQARTRYTACAAQQSESFFDSVKRMAKSVQGAMPIVGLISRLTADEGGFDELAYPEFCRYVINNASDRFKVALTELEKKHGKIANSRWLLLVSWMAKMGSGLVPAKDVISAARRLRVTQDMEIEIDRFQITRAATIKKYSMMKVPTGQLGDKVNVGVDAICTLCIGLKDGEPVHEDDFGMLADIVQGVFLEAERSLIEASIAGRAGRAGSYAAAS